MAYMLAGLPLLGEEDTFVYYLGPDIHVVALAGRWGVV